MQPDALREHLAQLHQELGKTNQVDPASNPLLTELLQDIKRLIEQPAAAAPSAPQSLPERLEQVAVKFEVNHPTLAASSRRLIDLLGKVGV